MQFINTILFAAAALASMANADNIVKFVNQDEVPKTVVFTANAGLAPIDDLALGGLEVTPQPFPDGWAGNWYTYSEGTSREPGMLGEVNFQGFAGATYFDVSGIVKPDDAEGVKILYPTSDENTNSGCQTSGSEYCANQYNVWDDVATVSTDSTELTCLVGIVSSAKKQRRHARHFVMA